MNLFTLYIILSNKQTHMVGTVDLRQAFYFLCKSNTLQNEWTCGSANINLMHFEIFNDEVCREF